MHTHNVDFSGYCGAVPQNTHEFDFSEADRASLGRFMMPADELLAELRAGANQARPEMVAAMLGVLKASLIGAGMGPIDAQATAFRLMHDGVDSSARSREICLKLLGGT